MEMHIGATWQMRLNAHMRGDAGLCEISLTTYLC